MSYTINISQINSQSLFRGDLGFSKLFPLPRGLDDVPTKDYTESQRMWDLCRIPIILTVDINHCESLRVLPGCTLGPHCEDPPV